MERRFFGLALGLMVAASPAVAADLAAETNTSLCIARNVELQGYPLAATLDEINAELVRRNESCEPAGTYAGLAGEWIAEAQSRTQPQPDPGPSWGERLRRASETYLRIQEQQRAQQQAAPRPTTTTCRDTVVGVQCTTL